MFSVTTPAILFPATSLILLAYTAKLIHLGSLIRVLRLKFLESKDPYLIQEIKNLKRRIYLIRNIQGFGVCCLFFCALCMIMLLADKIKIAGQCFSVSLIMLLCSLFLCFKEVWISARALNIELDN